MDQYRRLCRGGGVIITTTVQPKGRYDVAAVPKALEAVAAV